jgi:deoxycytidylate deaminase
LPGTLERVQILNDNRYLLCASLAAQSKGDERYGAIIVKDGHFIGGGFNRAIGHPAFRLERPIRQGMANHAEIEAICDVLMNTAHDPSGADLFVAGYFPGTGRLFFQEEYTCIRCPPHVQAQGLLSISVPLPGGWVKKSVEEALLEARRFTKGTHKKRLTATVGNFSIGLLAGRLLSPEQLKLSLRADGSDKNEIILPAQG